uniref:Angiopoietin-related protein 3 n=1 Tax=Cavia porcellus TaxID=10141 RepID=H0V783_CAVPO
MYIIKFFLIIVLLVLSSRTDQDNLSFDATTSEPKPRFAMLNDVKTVANGLLQLGYSFRDFTHKTKGQMRDIFQKLNTFDQSFYDLSLQTNEIKEDEEELRRTTSKLRVKNEEVKNMSLELNSKLETLLEEKLLLQRRVRYLEEQLTNLLQNQPDIQEHPEVTSLKTFVELRRIGIQELTENSLSSKPRAPRTTRTLQLNATKNAEQEDVPADCSAIYKRGEHRSGTYAIRPSNSQVFHVHCDVKAGSSWTLIQHRTDGLQNFNETWKKYKYGFGKLDGEFWLGLEKIYSIAKQSSYILRIELEDWKDNKYHVEYSFHLGSHETNYLLHLAGATGNGPEVFPEHKDLMFSTWDHKARHLNCSESYSGGWWWHDACDGNNLNGKYNKPRAKSKTEKRRGIWWRSPNGNLYSIKSTKILIHPKI